MKDTVDRITVKEIAIIAVHAFVGWMLCGAIVMIGREIWSIETTLIVHAAGVPVVFALISLSYFTYFAFTTPPQTATIFMLAAIFLDVIIVATFIEKSFEMFTSFLGTWLVFGLIFLTTYVAGTLIVKRKASQLAI
jgi:hypothetical protein